MTIEEKAQSYAGYNIPHSRDMVTIAKMNRRYDGFKAGARWMLDKAIKWLKENADMHGTAKEILAKMPDEYRCKNLFEIVHTTLRLLKEIQEDK